MAPEQYGYLPQEERQPADDKCAHDDSQCPGRLVLPLHLDEVPVVPGRRRMVIVGRQRGPGRRAIGRAVGPQLVLRHLPVVVYLVAAVDPRMDLLFLPVRLLEYRVVREQHNRARYPKRYRRGDDHVHLVHLKREQFLSQVQVVNGLVGPRGLRKDDCFEKERKNAAQLLHSHPLPPP